MATAAVDEGELDFSARITAALLIASLCRWSSTFPGYTMSRCSSKWQLSRSQGSIRFPIQMTKIVHPAHAETGRRDRPQYDQLDAIDGSAHVDRILRWCPLSIAVDRSSSWKSIETAFWRLSSENYFFSGNRRDRISNLRRRYPIKNAIWERNRSVPALLCS